MKKVLALMVGCALSGSLFAGHTTGKGGNPIDGPYVEKEAGRQVSAARVAILKTVQGANVLGQTYAASSTCGEAGGSCMLAASNTQVNGAMQIVGFNLWGISQPTTTGVDAAHQICHDEMEKRFGHNDRTDWSAWISDSTYSAKEHYTAGATYFSSNRALISPKNQLLEGGEAEDGVQVLSAAITFGVSDTDSNFVFTGSNAAGVSTGSHCNDWTSSDAAIVGTVGNAMSVTKSWAEAANGSCAPTNARGHVIGHVLLCIEHVINH